MKKRIFFSLMIMAVLIPSAFALRETQFGIAYKATALEYNHDFDSDSIMEAYFFPVEMGGVSFNLNTYVGGDSFGFLTLTNYTYYYNIESTNDGYNDLMSSRDTIIGIDILWGPALRLPLGKSLTALVGGGIFSEIIYNFTDFNYIPILVGPGVIAEVITGGALYAALEVRYPMNDLMLDVYDSPNTLDGGLSLGIYAGFAFSSEPRGRGGRL